MSITKQAVAVINRLGHGTVDDVLRQMPGYTRDQLRRALKHAAYIGLISTDGWCPQPRGSSARRGSLPATYRAIKKTQSRPAASVWQFAEQSLYR